MAKSEHKNAAADLFNLPSLSQVSFPSTYRSLNIESEGVRVGRDRFENLQAHPGVQFALSPEQLDHYNTAHQFLQQLYMELGFSFPETGPPFAYDRRFTETGGICDTLLRAPGIQYLSQHVRSREGYVAGWVHELTHASGAVRWGATRSAKDDATTQFTIAQAGWMMKLGGRGALFSAFEEYAATANECLYLSEVQGLTPQLSEDTYTLSLYTQRQSSVRISQLCAQLFEPERFAKIEESSNPRRWERAFLEGGSMCHVYTPRMNWLKDGADTGIFIYDICPLLDEFARELFPRCSAAEASGFFREKVLGAHLSGDLAPVLRIIKETLGREAVRFLAEWGPRKGDIITQDDTALLSLFVRAGRLGADTARSYRADLVQVLKERKGNDHREVYIPLRTESLLRDAERGYWRSWANAENRQLIAEDSELRARATECFNTAFSAGKLAEAAEICITGALDPESLPLVTFAAVQEYAIERLNDGEVKEYEAVVEVFSPERRVISEEQERKLVYAAAVAKLRSKRTGEFVEIAKSSLCDESMLMNDEICRLASEALSSLKGIQSKCHLFEALPKKIQGKLEGDLLS